MSDSFTFLKPYLRGWPIILIAMILGYIGASKYLNYVTPMYESTAKLRLADMGDGVPHSNLFKDLDVFASTQKLNTEIEVLNSHCLLNKVLDSLNVDVQIFRVGNIKTIELYQDSPIEIIPLDFQEKEKDKIFKLKVIEDFHIFISKDDQVIAKGVLGDTICFSNSKLIIRPNEKVIKNKEDIKIPDEYEFIVDSRQKLINDLAKNLDITAVDKDVAVVRISFKSPHPEKAALIPNAIAEAYIQDYIDTKFIAANITVSFLDDRINHISNELKKVENEILDYRNNKKITNLSQETETDLRKISQMKIQQTNLKMTLEAVTELEAYVTKGKDNFLELAPNFEAFTDLLSTEIIKKIKDLQGEKKVLLLKYTAKDERVIVIDSKIKDLTQYLLESIKNTRKNLEIKYGNLNKDIKDAQEVFIDVPEKEKMLTVLNREFNIYQQSYNFLNEKKIEAEIAKSAKVAFHKIITPASVSKQPVSPNRAIIKIVATILCLMGAIGFIFIVHSLKAKVNDAKTIEDSSMTPIVAIIPKINKTQEELPFFLKLVADWEVKKLTADKQIICLSGFNINEGASYIAHNLTKVFSFQKRSVLLIDFKHLIHPKIQTSLIPFKINELTSVMNVDKELLQSFSNSRVKEWILECSKDFDQTIVLNEEIGNQFVLSAMSVSMLNIICIDTRLTPAKKITTIDLLIEEYKLTNTFFALNRAGYNPSFIREVFNCFAYYGRTIIFLVRKKMNA